MPTFDSPTLLRFFNQGEQHLSMEKNFLYNRYSPALVGGQGTYVLPDYIKSIRRVTFLGWKLDPLPARTFREVFQSATQQGRPFWYVYNNIGLNTIQFFPCPQTSLAAGTDLWNQAGSNSYQTCLIIEYAAISNNSTLIAPPYWRRQLLKQWVAKQCFSIEGPGQNLKLAQYFSGRWDFKKGQFFDYLDDIHSKARKLIVSEIVSSNYFPASPVLPIANYGTPVNEGE
jgi:hypothetical protein